MPPLFKTTLYHNLTMCVCLFFFVLFFRNVCMRVGCMFAGGRAASGRVWICVYADVGVRARLRVNVVWMRDSSLLRR